MSAVPAGVGEHRRSASAISGPDLDTNQRERRAVLPHSGALKFVLQPSERLPCCVWWQLRPTHVSWATDPAGAFAFSTCGLSPPVLQYVGAAGARKNGGAHLVPARIPGLIPGQRYCGKSGGTLGPSTRSHYWRQ